MSRKYNQKSKMMYVLKILLKYTDEDHPMTMKEILKKLEEYGISAERKSVYADIEELIFMGYDIVLERSKNFGYFIASREFELPELKLLVDSVQSSKFITKKKSNQLIKKIENLTSVHQARKLTRYVYTSDRVKTLNETIYYSVDKLHDAIYDNNKISFKYYSYTPDKKKVLRNDGNEYIVSPYALMFSDENYYLVCHYPKYTGLTHFRVDKMVDIKILDEHSVDINEVTDEKFNYGDYSKKVFGMFSGETETVKLLCANSIINPVIDKFGEDVLIRREGYDKFIATVKIKTGPTFFAWVFTFEEKMQIIYPEETKNAFIEFLNNVKGAYDV